MLYADVGTAEGRNHLTTEHASWGHRLILHRLTKEDRIDPT